MRQPCMAETPHLKSSFSPSSESFSVTGTERYAPMLSGTLDIYKEEAGEAFGPIVQALPMLTLYRKPQGVSAWL